MTHTSQHYCLCELNASERIAGPDDDEAQVTAAQTGGLISLSTSALI